MFLFRVPYRLSPGSNLETLEVGDRILQVNGDPVEQKTLEEVSSFFVYLFECDQLKDELFSKVAWTIGHVGQQLKNVYLILSPNV